MATAKSLKLHPRRLLWITAAILSIVIFILTVIRLQEDLDATNERLILVMGLPRSGSRSIHRYFQCGNIASFHYCCDDKDKTEFPCRQRTCGDCVLQNMQAQRPAFWNCSLMNEATRVFSQFDVETTDPFAWFLPQHFALPLLIPPNSSKTTTLILNTRESPSRWASSVLHWHSVTTRLMNTFDLFPEEYKTPTVAAEIVNNKPAEVPKDELIQEMQSTLKNRLENQTLFSQKQQALSEIYTEHVRRIRKRYQSRLRIVEVNVDSPQAGNILQDAFGIDASCWHFDPRSLDEDWKDFETLPSL